MEGQGKLLHAMLLLMSVLSYANIGEMIMTLENDQKFSFPVFGTMKDILYSDSYTIAKDEDPKEAMAAVLGGDGDLVDEKGNKIDPPSGLKFLAHKFVA